MRAIVKAGNDKQLAAEVIEVTSSEWACLPHGFQKKEGSLSFCVE